MKVRLIPGEGRRAFHYLKILNEPGATICVGTRVGAWLHQEGLVSIVKWGRYGITQYGIDFLNGKRLGDDRQPQLDLGGTPGNSGELQALVSPPKTGGKGQIRRAAAFAGDGAGKSYARPCRDTAPRLESHKKPPLKRGNS